MCKLVERIGGEVKRFAADVITNFQAGRFYSGDPGSSWHALALDGQNSVLPEILDTGGRSDRGERLMGGGDVRR